MMEQTRGYENTSPIDYSFSIPNPKVKNISSRDVKISLAYVFSEDGDMRLVPRNVD